jgi:hypothetical protein
MSKASSFTTEQNFRGVSLEVNNYVVTFAYDFQIERIPHSDLNNWLRKIDQLVRLRLEFVQRLDQIGKEGLNESEVEAYRLSSKLYHQTCKIKNLPYIVSIDFKTKGSVQPLSQRVDCSYSRGCSEKSDDEAFEAIEQCWTEITEVVEKTLKELAEAPVFDRHFSEGGITDFREFNTTFHKAKETFEKFSVHDVKPFNVVF